jgi:hypothetical protein
MPYGHNRKKACAMVARRRWHEGRSRRVPVRAGVPLCQGHQRRSRNRNIAKKLLRRSDVRCRTPHWCCIIMQQVFHFATPECNRRVGTRGPLLGSNSPCNDGNSPLPRPLLAFASLFLVARNSLFPKSFRRLVASASSANRPRPVLFSVPAPVRCTAWRIGRLSQSRAT